MEVTIPEGLWDVALKEAETRYNRWAGVRSPNQNRGGKELEMLIDTSGVVGEVLVGYILGSMYSDIQSYVDDHVNFKNPDYIINSLIRVDVKTVPEGNQRKFLIVTKRAHEDPAKLVDFYIAVKIVSKEKAIIYNPISHIEISGWPNNQRICKFEEGHCMELAKLPLTDLNKIKETLNLRELLEKI